MSLALTAQEGETSGQPLEQVLAMEWFKRVFDNVHAAHKRRPEHTSGGSSTARTAIASKIHFYGGRPGPTPENETTRPRCQARAGRNPALETVSRLDRCRVADRRLAPVSPALSTSGLAQ